MSLKTELLAAIEQQNPSTVFKLLRTGLIDLQSDEFKTDNPLFKAVETGNASIVRLLTEHGASYNSTDESYDSPVTAFELAVNYDQEEIVDYFLTLEPTQAEIVGALAVAMNSQHIFAALVSKITDINGQYGDTGQTPLMAVAESANYLEDVQVGKDRLQRLLDLGANKELADREGRRASDWIDNPDIKLLLAPAQTAPKEDAMPQDYPESDHQPESQAPSQDEKLGCLMGGISFLAPPIGLAMYFMWKDTFSAKAKTAGTCGLVGLVLYVIYWIVGIISLLS